jgi:UDP-glucose 4-epimerase
MNQARPPPRVGVFSNLHMKILVTGAAGFIGTYLVKELLNHGHEVVGVDNYSKYGPIRQDCEGHPRYTLTVGDAKDHRLLASLLEDCDHFVAGAAMIGGISYFHAYAYDLIAENERLTAAAFDAALAAYKTAKLRKITVISSSMVFENAARFPSKEGDQRTCPPPSSTYGFQKLAVEDFAQGAYEQHGMPFTIARPFNCVGIGERRARGEDEIYSGNVTLAMSHVVPDLVQKVLKGQDPLHILGSGNQVRHYTYGGDLARGIRLCIEHPNALNEDFNLSTPQSTTVLELAERIWEKIHGSSRPFNYTTDGAFRYDVQCRIPDVSKAKELLGFEAETSLDDILDEVIPWIAEQVKIGVI